MIWKKLYQSYLFSYRTAAAIALYCFLIGVFAFGALWGFYAINASWVAPLRISPSNDKIMTMNTQLVASQAQINTLVVNNTNLEKTKIELLIRRGVLVSLVRQLDAAMGHERQANTQSGTELTSLATQKQADLERQRKVIRDNELVRAQIEKDLKAGLITKAEALNQEATLTQFQSNYTDSRVSEVVLRDNIHQKLSNDDLAAVDVLQKQVDLKSQIATIDLQIATGDVQYNNNLMQIDALKKAIATATNSPYFLATKSDHLLTFAFVPYDNQRPVDVNVPVYDCYLSFVVCRYAGKIQAVYSDEEKGINPIYKTDLRGFLVQLSLATPEAAKSKTLFVGRKPLLF